MNQDRDNEGRDRIFKMSTAVSDSNPWFLSLLAWCRERWNEYKHPPAPAGITAEPVAVAEFWSEHKMVVPRTLSVLAHISILLIVLIPAAKVPKPLPKGVINVALYAPPVLTLPVRDKKGGGGGGGKRELTPPSLGRPPRPSDKQFVPPDPEPAKNLDPLLVMEPSVVVPPLVTLPRMDLFTLGDPYGLLTPPSAGPGTGGGIGTGSDHGVGPSNGPGVGPGENGGVDGADTPLHIGGAVSPPVLLTQVLPEYSEEARKARFQGTVILDTIVRKDGTVQVVRIARSIGFGLDEKAIEAVLKWKFQPGRMNGNPVPVVLNVQVNFNLR
jgi:periplasmic protein TonB